MITFTVDPFDAILANSSSTPASCSGSCDGTATVGPTGGLGTLHVLMVSLAWCWTRHPAGHGPVPGPVQVIIADANGCSISADILILAPPSLVVDAAITPILCGGQCDGVIALNVSGGTAPFAYVWAPAPPIGQGTATASGLLCGHMERTVTDANGCDSTLVYDLLEPDPLTISVTVTPSQCQLCSGAAQLTLAGGTPFFLSNGRMTLATSLPSRTISPTYAQTSMVLP